MTQTLEPTTASTDLVTLPADYGEQAASAYLQAIQPATPLLSFEEEMARQEMWDSYTGVVPLALDSKDLPRRLEGGEVVIVLPVAGAIRYHVEDNEEVVDEKTGEVRKKTKPWDEYRIKLTDGRVVVCSGKSATARFEAFFSRIPQGDFPPTPAVTLEIRYRTLGNGHKMPVYAFKLDR